MALDGIIFGGMIELTSLPHPIGGKHNFDGIRAQDLEGISYSSVYRSAGSHRIASFLRQHGLDIEVVDFAPSWQFEEFQELIRSRITPSLKFVGLGAVFNMNTPTLFRCFTWLKQTYPDVILVTGAQGFHNLHFIPADYMVVGYGELAILEILNGTAKYTEEVIDKAGNKRRTVHAIHDYPAFPMPNLSVDYEKRDFLQPFESLMMETSRGCRFKCSFCTYPILGVKADHTRCTQDFHDNLTRNYENYGTYRYLLADETFNDYSEKIIKYADVVETLPFEPIFGGYIRADLLHTRPQDIEHLARMRLNSHFYGVESFHRPSAKAIGKGMDPDKIKQAILDTKDYMKKTTGYYRGSIGMIIGLPHETEETLNESKKWFDENWQKQHVGFGVLRIDSDHDNVKRSKLSTSYEKQGYSLVDPSELQIDPNHPDLIRISQSNILTPEVKRFVKMNTELRHQATVLLHHWKSNTGMTEKDAQMWVVRNVWGNDNFMDFGVDFWQNNEWYITGKTDQEMMGSYRDLGGFRPPIEAKVEFIEEYKKQKFNVSTT